MAYDKEQLLKEVKEVASKNKCFFIEQLISLMPCDKSTFYRLFPKESDEYNSVKAILDKNKVEVKTAMFKKWYDSDNATLQVALMKLICTDEEAHRLNGSKTEVNLTTEQPLFGD